MNLTRCDYCGQEWCAPARMWINVDYGAFTGNITEMRPHHFCTYSCLMEWADVKLQQYRKEMAKGI